MGNQGGTVTLTMEYCLAVERNAGGLMMPFGLVVGTLS